jgi:hypothetical protein
MNISGCDVDLTIAKGKKFVGWSKSMKAAGYEFRLSKGRSSEGETESDGKGGVAGRNSSPGSREPHDIFDGLERMFMVEDRDGRSQLDEQTLELEQCLPLMSVLILYNKLAHFVPSFTISSHIQVLFTSVTVLTRSRMTFAIAGNDIPGKSSY